MRTVRDVWDTLYNFFFCCYKFFEITLLKAIMNLYIGSNKTINKIVFGETAEQNINEIYSNVRSK